MRLKLWKICRCINNFVADQSQSTTICHTETTSRSAKVSEHNNMSYRDDVTVRPKSQSTTICHTETTSRSDQSLRAQQYVIPRRRHCQTKVSEHNNMSYRDDVTVRPKSQSTTICYTETTSRSDKSVRAQQYVIPRRRHGQNKVSEHNNMSYRDDAMVRPKSQSITICHTETTPRSGQSLRA